MNIRFSLNAWEYYSSWSSYITDKHSIIYKVFDDILQIAQFKYLY